MDALYHILLQWLECVFFTCFMLVLKYQKFESILSIRDDLAKIPADVLLKIAKNSSISISRWELPTWNVTSTLRSEMTGNRIDNGLGVSINDIEETDHGHHHDSENTGLHKSQSRKMKCISKFSWFIQLSLAVSIWVQSNPPCMPVYLSIEESFLSPFSRKKIKPYLNQSSMKNRGQADRLMVKLCNHKWSRDSAHYIGSQVPGIPQEIPWGLLQQALPSWHEK